MSDAVRQHHQWLLDKAVQAQRLASAAALTAVTGMDEERGEAAERAIVNKTRSAVWALAADKLRTAAGFTDAPESSAVLAPEPTEEDDDDIY